MDESGGLRRRRPAEDSTHGKVSESSQPEEASRVDTEEEVKKDEGQASSADKEWSAHQWLRLAIIIFVLACGPLVWSQWEEIRTQSSAVLEWRRTHCVLHNIAVVDAANERKGLVRQGSEYKVTANYSYIAGGQNRTSTRVYFMGRHHAGSSRQAADRRVQFFQKQCVANVNPSDPSESILIPEASFKPYTNLLFIVVLGLGLWWYATIEHSWDAANILPSTFEEAKDFSTNGFHEVATHEAERWYRVPAPQWIRGGWFVFLNGLVIVVMWHAFGYSIWRMYKRHPYVKEGGELIWMFHAAGVALFVRLLYFMTIIARVSEVELFIDRPAIEMGSPFMLCFKQAYGSAEPQMVYYRWVLDFTVDVAGVPFTYMFTVPFEAAIPDELQPQCDDLF
eukprot:gene16120-24695_t